MLVVSADYSSQRSAKAQGITAPHRQTRERKLLHKMLHDAKTPRQSRSCAVVNYEMDTLAHSEQRKKEHLIRNDSNSSDAEQPVTVSLY